VIFGLKLLIANIFLFNLEFVCMSVAVLSHSLSGTGVVRNGVRIANLAQSLGIGAEYWVISAEGPLRQDLHPDIPVVCIGPDWAERMPRRLAGLAAVAALGAMIRQRRPGILFSAGNHFHLTANLAFRLAGKPSDVRFAGRASNAMPGAERLGFLAQMPIMGGLLDALGRAKYAGMNPVIAVAEELGRSLAQIGVESQRIQVIPNGVNVEKVSQQAKEPIDHSWFGKDCPPVVVAAGRLTRQKNYRLLLDAFAIARKQHEMRLVILGTGSPAALASLQSQAKKLGIAADTRFEGFVGNPYAYFARAGLFVLSSRWEGMSNALLEAMACGCPVAAVAAPTGTAELLDHGRIGPLTPADPQALARAMLDRLAAARDSEKLRARAQEYDLGRTMEAYAKLLFSRPS
jgi:glycosyltransferase involved in cell wall biosynthesis